MKIHEASKKNGEEGMGTAASDLAAASFYKGNESFILNPKPLSSFIGQIKPNCGHNGAGSAAEPGPIDCSDFRKFE